MKEKNGEHPLGDVGQLVLLALFLAAWVLDSFVFRLSTFLAARIPLLARLLVPGLTLLAAVWLVRGGRVVVDHEKRPAGVVSSGAFRYVRHPLYLGTILSYFGLAISTASLICIGLLLLVFAFYNHIATYEERLMENRLGAEYGDYKRMVRKWVPRLPPGARRGRRSSDSRPHNAR